MAQYRNISDETVLEYVTGRAVEPDEVVDVPDEAADLYADHPVFLEVGAPSRSTTTTTDVDDASTGQEQS